MIGSHLKQLFCVAALCFGVGEYSGAQQKENYFFSGKAYGSEAIINPLSMTVNAGFDILQSATHSRQLSTMRFGTGLKNVWENAKDPFHMIDIYGWGKFLRQEVFPTSLDVSEAQYFPNYTLHLIGGGMDSRAMYEWFRFYGFPAPSLFAGLTIAGYHIVNEAAENDAYVGVNVDPLADLYIFDIGGVLLFTSDDVCEFFSKTMRLTSWPGQPTYNPTFGTIENQGQNYVMRYALPFAKNTSLFYYFGDSGLLGLSFPSNDRESISFGGGFVAKSLRNVDSRTGERTITVDLGWIAGVFYDRENSLLASFILSDRINEKAKVNIYPGVFSLGPVSPGVFVSIGKGNQLIAGMTVHFAPFGLAYRNSL